jgi:hypothetical protein
MAKSVLIEAFHLGLYVPRGLPDAAARAVRRTLASARFRTRLAAAARQVVRRHPSLAPVTVTLTR